MVALVCLTILAVQRAAQAPRQAADDQPESGAGAESSQEVPEANEDWPAGEVLHVHAQDHYLQVTTPSQRAIVRHRMRDALERLGQSDGLQVHRSWWVARGAVAQVARQGRDDVLVLGDGTRVPVARNRLPQLRAAGWL